ncbi:MAG: response regulator, partial [Lachnospiraceae bacterium]|nr:response regulator [Lachnospiraceae bacterium]
VLVCILGTGQVHKNLKFRTLTITIVIGNMISILDNIFRDSGMFPTPPQIKLALLLLVYLANIFLTYYMALYMEGFFEGFRYQRIFFVANTFMILSSIAITVAAYLRQIILYDGEAMVDMMHIQIRVILGYVFELYYLLYVITLFIILGVRLSRRARWTSISAFAVVIGSVLLELLNTFGITSGILFNYFGAVIGLYIFYIGVETPDYQNLLRSMVDLEEARKSADQASQAKSDFLANMSHEIRTPINTVLGMNEMILRESEDDSILTYSENIKSAGNTLLGLINDILDFSKIGAGKIDLIPAEYDLQEMIRSLVNMISIRAEEKGLLLKPDFDCDTPRWLYGDEIRIKQVITNILTNAVKYTEKGSVSFKVGYARCNYDPDSILLQVAVSDTGIGIKPEDIDRLFAEFERIEEKRNRNIEGTGLGMSITRSLLRLMGSSLEVQSTYGEGSTFSFELKQKVMKEGRLGECGPNALVDRSVRKKYHARFSAPDARILVVDDNKMNLMVIKNLIKQTQVQVDTAESGAEGIRLAGEKKYDILFLDHMMPEKDGIETLHELRSDETGPNIGTPAICLTANASLDAREMYKSEGFDDYLSKPINSEVLEAMLADYLPKEKLGDPDADTGSGADSSAGTSRERLSVLEDYDVDVEQGIERSKGVEPYITLLRVFYGCMDEVSLELDGFRAAGELDEYTIRIHSLKSSARIIGADSLGDRAQRLEDAAKKEDKAYVDSHHDDFIKDYRRLKRPLSALFTEGKKSSGKPAADENLMAAIYEAIKSAAEEMDLAGLDGIFAKMKGYEIPEAERERWGKVSAAYDKFDYDDMVSCVDL